MSAPDQLEVFKNLVIDVSVDEPGWDKLLPDAAHLTKAAISATWGRALKNNMLDGGLKDKTQNIMVEVSVILLSDERQQILNRDFRGKDKPTNVLSFLATGPNELTLDQASPDGPPILLGDISIALQITATEAKTQKITMANHFSHLVVHGMVHLLGFDHEKPDQAQTMENLETEILKELGIKDPYGA